MQASIGLSHLSSITAHFLNLLHWMVFDLFLIYCVTVKRSEVCNALFNQISTRCRSSNVANALGNIANAFKNNYSALESVSNRVKNVATHFRRIFNGFSTYLLCWVFANRITYRLTHTTETAIRRLVHY